MRVRPSRAKPIIRFSPLPALINNLPIRIIPNLYLQVAFCELFPDRLPIHLVGLRYALVNGRSLLHLRHLELELLPTTNHNSPRRHIDRYLLSFGHRLEESIIRHGNAEKTKLSWFRS